MKNYIIVLTTAFTVINFMACKPSCEEKGGHDSFTIVNRSGKEIDYKIMGYFSDTIIPVEYNAMTDQAFALSANSTITKKIGGLRKGECIEDYYTNGTKDWLYFFDLDTLKSLPWDTVRFTGRGVLERRLIDLSYLKDNNFTLMYEEK